MQKKHLRHTVLSFGSVLFILGSFFVSSPAQAGFKWVPPEAAEQKAAPAPLPAVPDPQSLPPIQLGPAASAEVSRAPQSPAPAPVTKAQTPSLAPVVSPVKIDPPVEPTKEAVVRGFADNVPLSVALRQVLPDEMGYAVAPDVSLSSLVSWKGGAPWRPVLRDMLASAGMSMQEEGKLVHIVRGPKGQVTSGAIEVPPPSPAPLKAPAVSAPATPATAPAPAAAPASTAVPTGVMPFAKEGDVKPPAPAPKAEEKPVATSSPVLPPSTPAPKAEEKPVATSLPVVPPSAPAPQILPAIPAAPEKPVVSVEKQPSAAPLPLIPAVPPVVAPGKVEPSSKGEGGVGKAEVIPVPKAEPSKAPLSANKVEPVLAPKAEAPLPSVPSADKKALPPLPPAKDVPPAKDKPSSVNYLVPPAGAQPSMNPVPLSEEQMPVAQSWTAEKGRLLKDVIEDWGRKAGVDVSWQAEYDYPLQASVSFMGSFEEAVRGILVGFQEAQPQPVAYLYNSQSGGQAVLVVQARGNNYTE